MSNRELLERTANAAGLVIVDVVGDVAIVRRDNPIAFKWTPLTDDGDALRLAVKLGLQITVGRIGIQVSKLGFPDILEQLGSDPHAATRRAIVRAAAEIGRAMP